MSATFLVYLAKYFQIGNSHGFIVDLFESDAFIEITFVKKTYDRFIISFTNSFTKYSGCYVVKIKKVIVRST